MSHMRGEPVGGVMMMSHLRGEPVQGVGTVLRAVECLELHHEEGDPLANGLREEDVLKVDHHPRAPQACCTRPNRKQ
eukprot:1003093-Pyramimonas_sp.AAC.1